MLYSLSDIRSAFLQYFVQHGHQEVSSSSLVPDNDPTLMFTNAGMVQFKDVFTGKKVLPFKRATTSQKSLRAGGKHNDLENVGYTARHHTFFEMLGNFSFGDYFKEQVIEFAWEVVTKVLGLPKEKLLVTVHASDEEAALIWKKVAGFENSKIIKIPTNDNFWSMGDTGPCGPCSEIFYDHGDKIQGGPPGSKDEDGDRFVEIWNLVFMQFETKADGSRTNLPKPSIDTGMGLERITAVLQGVHSNYDIDLFKYIISKIKDVANTDDPKYTSHYNVIADHLRAISFMISDGIIPSNEGRGYVLRRIVRRALRHGYMMGLKEPFLFKLTDAVKESMGNHYKELVESEKLIKQILKTEEDNFMKTIDKGMHILQTELDKLGSQNIFPADVAYKLYDTFGFPFDLTQDILKSENKKVDEAEFDQIVEKNKEKSKGAWAGTGDKFTDKVWFDIKEKLPEVEFLRKTKQTESEIRYIVKGAELAKEAEAGEEVFLIADKTPFYAESGGQVGDRGTIESSSAVAQVLDTKKIGGIVAHICQIKSGKFSVSDQVKLEIDVEKRRSCSKNHTATHILQKALKMILGDHIAQKGSLVSDEKLRFDFIHNGQITKEQIEDVEKIVLDVIDEDLPVQTEIMDIEDAKHSGALALFGEKYSKTVRVVTIGSGFSKELCGGEHVSNTGQIGCFKVVSVSSVGSGIKRIEAVTGRGLRKYFESEIATRDDKIEAESGKIKSLEKQMSELKANAISNETSMKTETLANAQLKFVLLSDVDQKTILNMIDKEKQDDSPKCVVVGNKNKKNDKLFLCIYTSNSLKISAKNIMQNLAEKDNIKFGGRDDLAQSGGFSESEFENYITTIKNILS